MRTSTRSFLLYANKLWLGSLGPYLAGIGLRGTKVLANETLFLLKS